MWIIKNCCCCYKERCICKVCVLSHMHAGSSCLRIIQVLQKSSNIISASVDEVGYCWILACRKMQRKESSVEILFGVGWGFATLSGRYFRFEDNIELSSLHYSAQFFFPCYFKIMLEFFRLIKILWPNMLLMLIWSFLITILNHFTKNSVHFEQRLAFLFFLLLVQRSALVHSKSSGLVSAAILGQLKFEAKEQFGAFVYLTTQCLLMCACAPPPPPAAQSVNQKISFRLQVWKTQVVSWSQHRHSQGLWCAEAQRHSWTHTCSCHKKKNLNAATVRRTHWVEVAAMSRCLSPV